MQEGGKLDVFLWRGKMAGGDGGFKCWGARLGWICWKSLHLPCGLLRLLKWAEWNAASIQRNGGQGGTTLTEMTHGAERNEMEAHETAASTGYDRFFICLPAAPIWVVGFLWFWMVLY